MKSQGLQGLSTGGALFLLTLGLAACTSAQAPPTSGAGLPAVATAPPAVLSANVDYRNAPEPPPNAIGGLPPEDLKATPKYGGTLRVAGGGGLRLDPHFPRSISSERVFPRMFASGLVQWDLKCNCAAPDLAESWEVAKDSMSYTFKIRTGVKFQNKPPVNGRAVTIEDIKWSMDRATDLENKSPGNIPRMRANFLSVKEFQIVDPTTFRIVMKQPDVNIMRHLMYEYMVVLPKEAAINGFYEETKAMIGSGPFTWELAQNTGENLFKKNPDFYIPGRPYLDGVSALAGVAAATTQAALKSKQVDMALGMSHSYAKVFFSDPEIRIFNMRGIGVGTGGFYFNVNNPPFNDVRVRRAFNLAIDRWEIYEVVYDNGFYPWGMIGAWQPWHWSEQKMESMPGFAKGAAKKQEIEEAKKLLAEAGYANGLTVLCECENPERDENMQQQMKKVGVTVNINLVQQNIQTTPQYMKDKQMSSDDSGGGHTPDYALINSWLCVAPNNMSNLCDPEVERLYNLQVGEQDQQKRMEVLDKIQQRLWDIMPMAITGRSISYVPAYKYVRGWRNNFYDLQWNQTADIINVWLDK